ncbi:MAG: hypothetical protein ACYTG1_09750 [Planctomycetota bacterium]
MAPPEGAAAATIRSIPPGIIVPSAALTIRRSRIKRYGFLDKAPEVGDLVYGRVTTLGFHAFLENVHGRIHKIHDGSRAVFVYGNRYAPDHYEGLVPDEPMTHVDLLARSGVVGVVTGKNTLIQDPTRVRVLGYVCDEEGNVVNTTRSPLIVPRTEAKRPRRARMILVVGTAMNSGKSLAAVACCWALSSVGHSVRASKITGTASLKDILAMNDAGASVYNDFTHFGYPSTYMLPRDDLLRIFNHTDLRYGNESKNYWVVELADGILQRETALLLASDDVTQRIHRLIFCAADALGCVGGLRVLDERFGLVPDAISGVLSSSPLARRELAEFTDAPVFDSLERNLRQISEILV